MIIIHKVECYTQSEIKLKSTSQYNTVGRKRETFSTFLPLCRCKVEWINSLNREQL